MEPKTGIKNGINNSNVKPYSATPQLNGSWDGFPNIRADINNDKSINELSTSEVIDIFSTVSGLFGNLIEFPGARSAPAFTFGLNGGPTNIANNDQITIGPDVGQKLYIIFKTGASWLPGPVPANTIFIDKNHATTNANAGAMAIAVEEAISGTQAAYIAYETEANYNLSTGPDNFLVTAQASGDSVNLEAKIRDSTGNSYKVTITTNVGDDISDTAMEGYTQNFTGYGNDDLTLGISPLSGGSLPIHFPVNKNPTFCFLFCSLLRTDTRKEYIDTYVSYSWTIQDHLPPRCTTPPTKQHTHS